MKTVLKIINAILFLAALGISFIKMIRLTIIDMSLIDLIQWGFGKFGESMMSRELLGLFQEDIKPFAILALVFVGLIVLGVLLSLFLPKKGAFLCDIFLSIIQGAGLAVIYLIFQYYLGEIQDGISMFGLDDTIQLNSEVLIVWGVIYVLILVFSIIGLAIKEKQKEILKQQIMTEQFHPRNNPLSKSKKGVQSDEALLDDIRRLEKEKNRQQIAREVSMEQTASRQNPVVQEERDATANKFSGAIVGVTGQYASKTLLLEGRRQVYFVPNRDRVTVEIQPASLSVASVYYIEEYGEYCVKVRESNRIFLTSGQPLGKNRSYYLPRGTEIYINTTENRFRLA